jgi:ABC-type glycerol-3-phosphate transport system permease component
MRWDHSPFQRFLTYLLLILGGLSFVLPFLWMIGTALKPDDQLFSASPIPWPPRLMNFPDAINAFPFLLYTGNTMIITGLCIVGTAFSSAIVGYAFGRLHWPGRDLLFVVLLATMMIPPQVTMVPVFLLFRELGWYNTFLPLTVPAFLGGGAFYIFLMRQFFRTLPKELEEAALIDGCSHFQIFWHIMLPLTKPALATVSLFTFIAAWNDFMTPLIYLSDERRYTLALGLQSFLNENLTEWNLLMAASTLAMLPIIILFFYGQRFFVEGIALTGTKG